MEEKKTKQGKPISLGGYQDMEFGLHRKEMSTLSMTFILLNKNKNNYVISSDSRSFEYDGTFNDNFQKIFSNDERTMTIGLAGSNGTIFNKGHEDEYEIDFGKDIVSLYINVYSDRTDFNYYQWLIDMIDDIYADLSEGKYLHLLIARTVDKQVYADHVYVSKEYFFRGQRYKIYPLPKEATTYAIGVNFEEYNDLHEYDVIPLDFDRTIKENQRIVQEYINDKSYLFVDGLIQSVTNYHEKSQSKQRKL